MSAISFDIRVGTSSAFIGERYGTGSIDPKSISGKKLLR
jgi:hypothetical protein